MTNGWNISVVEGKKTLIRLLIQVIENNSNNIDIKYINQSLKKEAKKITLDIKRNGKKRNINNYIKVNYGSLDKLLVELNHIFYRKGDMLQISSNYKEECQEYEFI